MGILACTHGCGTILGGTSSQSSHGNWCPALRNKLNQLTEERGDRTIHPPLKAYRTPRPAHHAGVGHHRPPPVQQYTPPPRYPALPRVSGPSLARPATIPRPATVPRPSVPTIPAAVRIAADGHGSRSRSAERYLRIEVSPPHPDEAEIRDYIRKKHASPQSTQVLSPARASGSERLQEMYTEFMSSWSLQSRMKFTSLSSVPPIPELDSSMATPSPGGRQSTLR